ncbi:cation:proton antiporter domain-containing protein, partial [Streptomyces olivaceoviridis]
MSTTEMGPAFFLAAAVILTACRLVSRLLRPLGQPPVVGEMVAGVALGPSVLGLLSPGLEKAVFPDRNMNTTRPTCPATYSTGRISS